MSLSSKRSPHSGQNFGGLVGSAGTQPHLSQRKFIGFLAPHSGQNLPLFTAPQEQVQLSSAGFFAPHSGQNLPVAVAPQAHFQAPCCSGSGFFAPQFGQNLPVAVLPQEQRQPSPAA